RVATAQGCLVGLHRPQELIEFRVLAEGLVGYPRAFSVTLTTEPPGITFGLGLHHGNLPVGFRPDATGCFLTAGTELGSLTLPVGLHPLVDRSRVLGRQVDTLGTDVDHLDTEVPRFVVDLLLNEVHQLSATVTNCVSERCRA